jgi:hypothetical protein
MRRSRPTREPEQFKADVPPSYWALLAAMAARAGKVMP